MAILIGEPIDVNNLLPVSILFTDAKLACVKKLSVDFCGIL